MKREIKVYETVKNILYKHANCFRKKHGNWLVMYAPKNQVVIMDTWNGHISQAHMVNEPLVDDGCPDGQLRGRFHTHVCSPKYGETIDLKDIVSIYKTLLPII